MKAVRYLSYVAAGLVLLTVVAAGALIGIVDGEFVKRHAQRLMQEDKRTLSIEGTPKGLFQSGARQSPLFHRVAGDTATGGQLSGQWSFGPAAVVGMRATRIEGAAGRRG